MRVVVIGAGPAGVTAACVAASNGHSVILLEKNEKIGKKLYITGKGRCNITNTASMDEFIKHTAHNANFLYTAYYNYTNADLRKRLNDLGVPTVVERGGRVFPKSMKSSDVNKALEKWIKVSEVNLFLFENVTSIQKNSCFFIIQTEKNIYEAEALVISTGGRSYSSTGSTGDGYDFATKFGHRIIPQRPSLVSINLKSPYPELAGLSLRNVQLIYKHKTIKYCEFGEMLFTHKGISGPIVLKLSALEHFTTENAYLEVDLKPALTDEILEKRILRDFEKNQNKNIKNALKDLLLQSLIPIILKKAEINSNKSVHQITKKERVTLKEKIKHWDMKIESLGSFEEAIITRGGVDVKSVSPSTMESKLVKNLYFAGEVLDVDALTGGFNLQIAFSTGYLAGNSIGDKK